MNIIEMYELVKKFYEEQKDNFDYIGLRFEDKKRDIGDVCECSRHNPDRNDERDFPEYGTQEYEDMKELDGTSAWDMHEQYVNPGLGRLQPWQDKERDCRQFFLAEYCYVIASNEKGWHNDPDFGEILIKDAVVIAQIF